MESELCERWAKMESFFFDLVIKYGLEIIQIWYTHDFV